MLMMDETLGPHRQLGLFPPQGAVYDTREHTDPLTGKILV